MMRRMMRRTPEKFFVLMLTVRGDGEFPLDMLRYDSAVPATTTDAKLLGASSEAPARTVKLKAFKGSANLGYDSDSIARWGSYGWTMLRVESADGEPLYRDLAGLREGDML